MLQGPLDQLTLQGKAHVTNALFNPDLSIFSGGTAAASVALALQASAVPVGACFVAELCGLAGRERLGQLPVLSLVEYAGA